MTAHRADPMRAVTAPPTQPVAAGRGRRLRPVVDATAAAVAAGAYDVTRTFNGPEGSTVTALDKVTVQIPAGQLVGMLGPNGAGKTTLISLFTGLRTPTSGRVEIFGGDPRTPATRRALGVAPQDTGLPATLRVGEVLDFVAGHYANPIPTCEIAERFGLASMLKKQTGSLSGGQKRRVLVALALVGRPRLAVLDEPTTGLDVSARRALWDGLRASQDAGTTIVLTSHYLEEIQAMAQRVIVLDQGRVLADGDVGTIVGRVAARHVCVRVPAGADLSTVVARSGGRITAGSSATVGVNDGPGSNDAGSNCPDLNASAAVADASGLTQRRFLVADSDVFVGELVHSGVPFADLEIRGSSLEEAFLVLTQEGGR